MMKSRAIEARLKYYDTPARECRMVFDLLVLNGFTMRTYQTTSTHLHAPKKTTDTATDGFYGDLRRQITDSVSQT